MKRILVVIAALMSIAVLSGCGAHDKSADISLDSDIDRSFTAQYNEMTAEGRINVADGITTVSISRPAPLNGMKIVSDGENVTAEFLGIKKTLEPSSIPQTAFIPVLTDSLLSAMRSDGGERTDGGYIINGEYGGGKYTIKLDDELKLASLSVPDYGLSVTFSD